MRYVETMFAGNNISQRVNAAIVKLMEITGDIKTRQDAVVAYRQADGEKVWGDLPFTFDTGKHWKGLAKAAVAAGFVYEIVENADRDEVAVYVAPRPRKECPKCSKLREIFMAN
jgi:hypothetical protein